MFRPEDIELAQRIVSVLDLPADIGEDDEIEDVMEHQLEGAEIDGDYYVTSGVSKAVIVIENLPFVIKTPFSGYWGDFEEDGYDTPFYHFSEANEICPDDYCFDELQKTRRVEEEGFGMFVPHMEFLCEFNGRPFYIQGKARQLIDSRNEMNPSRDSMQKAKNYSVAFVKEWVALAIDFYGEETWNSFIQWATENEPSVLSDMHGGNYGLDMEGRPVMFDISGFRD